jgi:hypothetical protein
MATIDATLNTANYVSNQPSELSIDGVISQGGTSTSINCASLTIRFDPAKVTLSGLRSGPNGWGLAASNTSYLSEGWMKAVLNNSSGNAGQGQTSTGPLMYFTVTPVDASVNVNDCATLQLTGSESDLSDQDYETTYPSDPCNGIYAPSGGPEIPAGGGRDGGGPMDPTSAPLCDLDIPNAIKALKIAGGLLAASPADVVLYDWDYDGIVAVSDAVAALRACPNRTANIYFATSNCSTHPAVSPVTTNGFPVITFTADYADPPSDAGAYAGYPNSPFYYPNDPANYNWVWAAGWQAASNGWGIQTGWPQGTRDYPAGTTIGDLGGPKILATNFQDWKDYFAPTAPRQVGLTQDYSRVYVWGPDASDVSPWAPGPVRAPSQQGDTHQLFSSSGVGNGHSYAAPTLYDFFGKGANQMILASLGVTGASGAGHRGQVQIFGATGALMLGTTQDSPINPSDPFYTYDNFGDSAFYVPPVFARPSLNAARDLVAPSYNGKVYRWRNAPDTEPVSVLTVPGWYPAYEGNTSPQTQTETVGGAGAVIFSGVAAADLDGGGSDEIVAATGYLNNHYYDPPVNDGRVYCWNTAGSTRWVYPQVPLALNAGFTSGVAVGHLRGAGQPLSVVVGDAAGWLHVINLDASGNIASFIKVNLLDDSTGTLFPHRLTTAYPFDSIVAAPVIGDVDGDRVQDIVVGGSDGYINALKNDGTPIWRVPMPEYVDNSVIPGTHLLVVRGIALASLRNNSHMNVIVTCGVNGLSSVPTYPRVGQMLILDCGPDTYNANSLDWPQYQQNARRTGFLPPPPS